MTEFLDVAQINNWKNINTPHERVNDYQVTNSKLAQVFHEYSISIITKVRKKKRKKKKKPEQSNSILEYKNKLKITVSLPTSKLASI